MPKFRKRSPELVEAVSQGDVMDPKTGLINGLKGRDHAFIRETLDNGGDMHAAIRSVNPGLTEGAVRSRLAVYRRDPVMVALINRKLKEHGLITCGIDILREGMKAKVSYKDKDTGIPLESDVPDHRTRIKAAETIFKLGEMVDHEVHQTQEAAFLDDLPLPILEWMSRQADGRLPTEAEWKEIMRDVADVPATDVTPKGDTPEVST